MNTKKQIYVSLFFFFLITAFLLLFIIVPLLNKIKKLSEEFILLRKKLVFLEARLSNAARIKDIEEEIELFLNETKSMFADKEVPISFLNFLEASAKECKVLIKMSPLEKKAKEIEVRPTIYIQIAAVSSFPNINCFLEKIETGSYLVEFLNLEFAKLTESDLKLKESNLPLNGDIKAVIFLKALAK